MSNTMFSKTRAQALAWILALLLTSIAVWSVGESPLHVLKVLFTSAIGNVENFSFTLLYATPLILTGTAVTLALESGLFNIGAEGQLYIGAICAAAWGVWSRSWFPAQATSSFFAYPALMGGALVSFAGGAFWGSIAGYLRARRQTHEVIATIMLNFVAMAFANWAVLNPLKNTETQNLETLPIPEAMQVHSLWNHMTWGFPLAVVLAAVALWALKNTWWGFRTRATGQNPAAAAHAGIATDRTAITAMALSGGVAGLVGFHEVFFHSYKLLDAFSPGIGFTGLAIALLARGNFVSLLLASLLFGALQKGALDLDLETEKVTRDLSAVIQALILVALAAQPFLSKRKSSK